VVFVEVDPRLGVATRGKPVAASQEVFAQLGIFEELAIERDPDVARLVGNRLSSSREVNDGESPGTQGDPGLAVDLLVIGAAVCDRA